MGDVQPTGMPAPRDPGHRHSCLSLQTENKANGKQILKRTDTASLMADFSDQLLSVSIKTTPFSRTSHSNFHSAP